METSIKLFQKLSDRLRYIEFCLIYKGFVTRGDVINKFGISEASATRSIKEYIDLSDKKNAAFNTETKANEISDSFTPLYDISEEEALYWLQLESSPLNHESLIYSFDHLNLPEQVDFAPIIQAIIKTQCVKVRYMSLENGEKERVIAPHSIFNDGLRIYVRAFDRDRNIFITLHPARMMEATLLSESPLTHEQQAQDHEWNNTVELSLVAHPKLSEQGKAVIQYEYKMMRGKLKVKVRQSTACHFLAAWHVDCSTHAILSENIYCLWLENKEVIKEVGHATAPGYEK